MVAVGPGAVFHDEFQALIIRDEDANAGPALGACRFDGVAQQTRQRQANLPAIGVNLQSRRRLGTN